MPSKLYADKKITEQEYFRFKKAASDQQAEMDRQRKMQQMQATLGNLGPLANALGQMFGQSKELAIAQAAISGAQAVLSVWQAPASLPQPYDSILKGIITAGVVVQTVKQIGTIRNQKAPKAPKFFYGGSTGTNAALGYDEFGPVTGYVHKNEYVIPEVMTQDPRFANTITWLEANRQSKMRGYVDGGATSPGIVGANPVETSSNETAMLVNAVNNLNATLSNGIMAKLNLGYKDVEAMEDMKNEISSASQNGTIG